MERTRYMKLNKPSREDFVDINIFNQNSDLIDEKIQNTDILINQNKEKISSHTHSSYAKINEIPTKLSDLENDTNFISQQRELSDNISSIRSDIGASSKAVKKAYDKGFSALKKANDAYQKAQEAFQSASNGKKLICNAITGLCGNLNLNGLESFTKLAKIISNINIGLEYVSGEYYNSNTSSTKIILPFKPTFLIAISKLEKNEKKYSFAIGSEVDYYWYGKGPRVSINRLNASKNEFEIFYKTQHWPGNYSKWWAIKTNI